jgi:hypothetical protein
MKLSEDDAAACARAAMDQIQAMQGRRLGRGRNAVSELGDAVGRAVRATLLLRTLDACGWNLKRAAQERGLGSASAPVIREIRHVGLVAEYEAARKRGDVVRGGARRDCVKKNP